MYHRRAQRNDVVVLVEPPGAVLPEVELGEEATAKYDVIEALMPTNSHPMYQAMMEMLK